ncbi:MAG: flavodoxin domain-containing protein [Melioribacteraceae bacterium]|nr:flavodoxin domain-containing protein [Melioribacteraceae bacterium]
MKTVIIYISKHGTTEKVTRIIADKLNSGKTELVNLRNENLMDIEIFDRIIIGGSIHMASVHKKTKKFCELNNSILLKKTLGLFLCCMETGEKSIEQFENAFSENLRKHATSTALLGYEYNLDKMNFFERTLVKKISGSKESISEIDYKRIENFVTELENNK